MSSSPQSEKELNGAESTPNAVIVREQLRRILAHPLFANSKRYPVLLAYTVEQTLDGNASEVKERTIGVEAFGREPDYDVNVDPVVRMTAAEVRKRLIQYYYNPDHAGELVIELPVGSYVPSFREPAAPHTALAAESSSAQTNGDVVASAVPLADSEQAPSGPTVRRWIWIAMAFFALWLSVSALAASRFPTNLRIWSVFGSPSLQLQAESPTVLVSQGTPKTTTGY